MFSNRKRIILDRVNRAGLIMRLQSRL